MKNPAVQSIKKSQKEKLLFREINKLFVQASLDDENLRGLSITRVELSPDKSTCSVFFYIPEGQEAFKKKLEELKLYKPSMRKALAELQFRYVPEIIFKFDKLYEKQEKIEKILDQIKEEEKL